MEDLQEELDEAINQVAVLETMLIKSAYKKSQLEEKHDNHITQYDNYLHAIDLQL